MPFSTDYTHIQEDLQCYYDQCRRTRHLLVEVSVNLTSTDLLILLRIRFLHNLGHPQLYLPAPYYSTSPSRLFLTLFIAF